MSIITATSIRRFSRHEYHEMARTGILRPEERVELIHGEILAMTPQGTPHAAFIDFLDTQLQRAFGDGVAVRTQHPLALGETSEPEPDVAVVPGQPLDYVHAHPTTALLIVEVAGTSLSLDRTVKALLYAEHGIPEYWIVNINDRQLEVFRNPSSSVYETHKILRADESVSPLHAPNFSLPLANLFSTLQ
jgi:Uma2 family endonuclease